MNNFLRLSTFSKVTCNKLRVFTKSLFYVQILLTVLFFVSLTLNVKAGPNPDGSGTMVVSGTTAVAGSTGNSFTFSFAAGTGINMDGGEVTLVIPSGWTTPQTTTSSSAGYISLTSNPTNKFSIGTISGSGPWTIPINCAPGAGNDPTFVLTYAGGGNKVTAPSSAGTYTFTTQQKSSGGGTLTNIATQPTITVTSIANSLDHFAISTISSPQTAGTAITGITITAQTPSNGTVTTFTGTVTYGGTAGITGTSASFTAGVLSGVSVTPTTAGSNLTFTVSDGSGHTGSSTFNVNPGNATQLVITGSSTQTAGTTQNLTITAEDANGNTATTYAGSKNLTFSGASSSSNPVEAPTVVNSNGTAIAFGSTTDITFSSGVATVSSGENGVMELYDVQTATISVTDGTISSSGNGNLSVTVTPAPNPTQTFASGSYIIDMGQNSSLAVGLMPYGLVYALIQDNVPVYWAINSTKAKDGVDFIYNSTSYSGGPFIIAAADASSPTVQNLFTTWKAKGVVIVGPMTSFTAQVYTKLTSWPIAVIDAANAQQIVEPYYTDAGVPSTSYKVGEPDVLNSCGDMYVLEHADPDMENADSTKGWTTKDAQTLKSYMDNGGYMWLGCHAGSAIDQSIHHSGAYLRDILISFQIQDLYIIKIIVIHLQMRALLI